MRSLFFLLLVTLAVYPHPPLKAEEVSGWDRFRLFNHCQPIDLVVEGLHDNAETIGLKEEAIVAAVRSRLRAARLYDEHSSNYLYVQTNVHGPAFSVDLFFRKWLHDPASDEVGPASTWQSGATGTHGDNASFIVSAISTCMDRFLDEYLRVNAEACE